MRKEGKRLIIEAAPPKSLLALLDRALEVLSFDAHADKTCGLLRARLEQVGKPTGANDLLIAVQTLSLGHVLVTDNEREFARVA